MFFELRRALRGKVRQPDREWVQVLRLLETHAEEEVTEAVRQALQGGSPRLDAIRMILRRVDGPTVPAVPVALARDDLAGIQVLPPVLSDYDALVEATA